ncbi:hypothetical protein ON010_g11300 [Phytophthora cinnamomi]|nr:hypothetical protein ON010_g11300 [Phytophthora cinnamomi]
MNRTSSCLYESTLARSRRHLQVGEREAGWGSLATSPGGVAHRADLRVQRTAAAVLGARARGAVLVALGVGTGQTRDRRQGAHVGVPATADQLVWPGTRRGLGPRAGHAAGPSGQRAVSSPELPPGGQGAAAARGGSISRAQAGRGGRRGGDVTGAALRGERGQAERRVRGQAAAGAREVRGRDRAGVAGPQARAAGDEAPEADQRLHERPQDVPDAGGPSRRRRSGRSEAREGREGEHAFYDSGSDEEEENTHSPRFSSPPVPKELAEEEEEKSEEKEEVVEASDKAGEKAQEEAVETAGTEPPANEEAGKKAEVAEGADKTKDGEKDEDLEVEAGEEAKQAA